MRDHRKTGHCGDGRHGAGDRCPSGRSGRNADDRRGLGRNWNGRSWVDPGAAGRHGAAGRRSSAPVSGRWRGRGDRTTTVRRDPGCMPGGRSARIDRSAHTGHCARTHPRARDGPHGHSAGRQGDRYARIDHCSWDDPSGHCAGTSGDPHARTGRCARTGRSEAGRYAGNRVLRRYGNRYHGCRSRAARTGSRIGSRHLDDLHRTDDRHYGAADARSRAARRQSSAASAYRRPSRSWPASRPCCSCCWCSCSWSYRGRAQTHPRSCQTFSVSLLAH